MLDSPSKGTAAAWHEAGHAVGAYLLGVPFGDISLAAPDSGEGSVIASITVKGIRESNLCWVTAVVLMRGREGERLAFGRADRSFLQNDAASIAGIYLTFFGPGMSCQRFRSELRARTRQLVGRPGFREALGALARLAEAERVVPPSRAIDVIRKEIAKHTAS
jgi:hypothetical protein